MENAGGKENGSSKYRKYTGKRVSDRRHPEHVMCKNIGKDIGASFRNMVGGEMQAYTRMMAEAKDKAISYMINQAMSMGADAIVNVRFASTTIVAGGAEILVSGTAVKFTA